MTTHTPDVSTWADYQGVWHARIPEGYGSQIARSAIICELAQREGPNFDPQTVSVVRADMQTPNSGTVTYREE